MGNQSVSAKIHARLNHPVIDADGHWIEFEPTLLDYLDGVAGPSMVDRFRRDDYLAGLAGWSRMSPEERRARRRHNRRGGDCRRVIRWIARRRCFHGYCTSGWATSDLTSPLLIRRLRCSLPE
jgi:hypothetical protein